MATEVVTKGVANRGLPQPVADNVREGTPIRLSRYGGQITESVVSTKQVLADEGGYFVATNPTPGTAFAYPVLAAFADTTPGIYMFNKDAPANASAKRIYLDYIKIIVTTVPASTTSANFAIKLDSAARALTTDNTVSLIPANVNMDLGTASLALVKAQNSATASVIAAGSASSRLVSRGVLGGLPIVGDELVIAFGSVDPAGAYGATNVASRKVTSAPPVVIGPGQSLAFSLWFIGNAATGLSYELEVGWWER